jgi:hypothetical protein
VIVVGYSFRDEHITKIFWDSARRNNDLHVVLIDPSAQEIYEKRLQFYDGDHSIPSSLDGKVICLPYKFEKVFSSLKNYYLKNLREGLAKEKELNHAESNGEKVNWQPVLTLLSNAEFVEKCERILSALDQPIQLERSIVDNFPAILEVYLKMILNLIINKQNAAVQGKLEIFFRLLRETFIQGINADISLPVINIRFNKVNIYDVGVFQKRLHLLSEYCETRRNFAILDSLHSGLIQRIYEGLEELTIYLEPYKSGSITFADYIALKRVGDDEGKEFAAVVDLYKKSTSISSDTLQRLIAIFIESEKKNLLIILDSFAV